MDTAYIAKLLLSALIFAPGIILLAAALVVGLLMQLEKLGLARKGKSQTDQTGSAPAVNPPAGEIVADLHRTIEPGTVEEDERTQRAS